MHIAIPVTIALVSAPPLLPERLEVKIVNGVFGGFRRSQASPNSCSPRPGRSAPGAPISSPCAPASTASPMRASRNRCKAQPVITRAAFHCTVL